MILDQNRLEELTHFNLFTWRDFFNKEIMCPLIQENIALLKRLAYQKWHCLRVHPFVKAFTDIFFTYSALKTWPCVLSQTLNQSNCQYVLLVLQICRWLLIKICLKDFQISHCPLEINFSTKSSHLLPCSKIYLFKGSLFMKKD